MSRDISKRWCGAGSTPYSLAHRLKRLLVFLLRHKIFAALARDSRELIVTHPIRVNYATLFVRQRDRSYRSRVAACGCSRARPQSGAETIFDRGSKSARRENLRLNGATREEAEFLLTRRVELNALTSDQLVAFIERKLVKHGIKKMISKPELLRDAYRLFVSSNRVEEIIEKVLDDIESEDIEVPSNLTLALPSTSDKIPNCGGTRRSRRWRRKTRTKAATYDRAHKLPNRHASLSFGFERPDVTVTRPYIASPQIGPIAGNMTGVEQAGGHRWNTKDAA